MRINFLHGLDDDIREQALQDFWKENRNFLFGAVVLLFVSFGATQYYKTHKAATIQQHAIAFYKASQDESPQSFADLAAEADGGYRAMAYFELARKELDAGNLKAAAEAYGQVRESKTTDLVRDLATILEAELIMADEPTTAEMSLKALVVEKSPYMLTALELLAILAQNSNKPEIAQNYYEELLAQGGLAETMRNRIEARLSYMRSKGQIAETTKGATN